MTSEFKDQDRRNSVLATVIGAVLASYAGGAAAVEFEFDNGAKVNWNTTLSAGSSWRSENASRALTTFGDRSLLGKYTGNIPPGVALPSGNGTAGNWSAGEATLNYDRNDRFSTPFKLLSDVEYKQGKYGGLVRIKAWYDYATSEGEVNLGNQANSFNGQRPPVGPTLPNCFLGVPSNLSKCVPMSSPGNNVWRKDVLSDKGFEDEQKFSNLMLLDAYVYGSFDVGDSDLQLRLGNQVVNWGESIFIQGINQINPIDVPAARRSGAEIKEILLPAWMAYAIWGLSFGSVEAFYQFEWNNTSIDSCGTYWSVTSAIISTRAGVCNSATAFGNVLGTATPGTASPLIAQYGSAPWLQANGLYVPLVKGKEPSNSGQFGLAFRFPIEKLDTEFGLYGMNIHSRIPVISSRAGTSPNDLTATERAVLTGANLIGQDTTGYFYRVGTTNIRTPIPFHSFAAAAAGQQVLGKPIVIQPSGSYWEYPEDIQIFGLTSASNIAGWSVSSELSYTKDQPVQINGNDLLLGGFLLAGPNAADSKKTYAQGTGGYLQGFDYFDKTQFQVNALKTYSNILGAENMLIIGEIGAQWNNVPDYTAGSVRYGRAFAWGYGSSPAYATGPSAPTAGTTCSPTFAGLPVPVPAGTLYNPSPRGCKNDGYVTDFAWGYRLRVSMDYNNVFNTGVTMTPNVFWSQDVEGVSMDPAFIEDRSALNLGLRFNYNKRYQVDMNWVQFGNSGYDPLQDRDYYSASISMTF
jgi:hypothetical protein